jgi:hypothetical protein
LRHLVAASVHAELRGPWVAHWRKQSPLDDCAGSFLDTAALPMVEADSLLERQEPIAVNLYKVFQLLYDFSGRITVSLEDTLRPALACEFGGVLTCHQSHGYVTLVLPRTKKSRVDVRFTLSFAVEDFQCYDGFLFGVDRRSDLESLSFFTRSFKESCRSLLGSVNPLAAAPLLTNTGILSCSFWDANTAVEANAQTNTTIKFFLMSTPSLLMTV